MTRLLVSGIAILIILGNFACGVKGRPLPPVPITPQQYEPTPETKNIPSPSPSS